MTRTMLGSALGAVAAVAVLTVGGVASAATTHDSSVHASNTGVCPVVIGNDGGTPVLVPATLSSTGTWNPGTTAASAGQLAFTGTDVAGVALVGGGLLLGGTLLVRASRFRRPAQS